MYYVRHRVVIGTLCFAVKKFCISINNIFLFFKGGLLCVENRFI